MVKLSEEVRVNLDISSIYLNRGDYLAVYLEDATKGKGTIGYKVIYLEVDKDGRMIVTDSENHNFLI